MAKLKDDPITAKDLEDFVNHDSDFAFEMRVLKQLRELGFECSHSGTYRDPVTEKFRQYDIRAVKHQNQSTLALAVECKNFRPNNPILLSAVPRTTPEAFHDLVVYTPQRNYIPRTEVCQLTGNESAYRPGGMVAKKTDQVGRDTSNALFSNDEAAFEKLNQAVNSCKDLILPLQLTGSGRQVKAIVPLLVVPTDLLWQVDYTSDGSLQTPPRVVPRSVLYLDYAWDVISSARDPIHYRLSHIEFATLGALPEIVSSYFGTDGFFR